jgi:ribonuclease HI
LFKAYPTYEQARSAFIKAYVARNGTANGVLQDERFYDCPSAPTCNSAAIERWRTGTNKPSIPFFCTDAACTNPAGGVVEYRCVFASDTVTAVRPVFAYGPFSVGSHNIGEYVGLVRALMWIQDHSILNNYPVYTDSCVAISWVAKQHGSNSGLKKICKELVAELALCDVWVANTQNWPIIKQHVRHWDTAAWGEIPADYDRK